MDSTQVAVLGSLISGTGLLEGCAQPALQEFGHAGCSTRTRQLKVTHLDSIDSGKTQLAGHQKPPKGQNRG